MINYILCESPDSDVSECDVVYLLSLLSKTGKFHVFHRNVVF